MSGKNVIWVGPADGSNAKPLCVEGKAAAAIKPGTLLDFNTNGNFVESTTAAANYGELLLVADKDQMRSRKVTDNWVSGENVVAIQPRSGELVNVLATGGGVVAIGASMTRSAANGQIRVIPSGKVTGAGAEDVIGYADEALTLTSTAQLMRIRVA